MNEWKPPRCEHGRILLGCPYDDCATQNAYLAEQDTAIREWERRQQQAARDVVRGALGLPLDVYVYLDCH